MDEDGIALLKAFEQFRSLPYDDGYGILTIGYGHKIQPGEHFVSITEDEGEKLLQSDLCWAESCVHRLTRVPLVQSEQDALISLCYNIGCHNFANSTLLKLINVGDFDGAAGEFPKWDHSNGSVSRGLLRRRMAEQEYFKNGILRDAIKVWES